MNKREIRPAIFFLVVVVAAGGLAGYASAGAFELAPELVVDELHAPIYVTSPPDSADQLFIVQQNGLILKFENDQTTPFLDLSPVVHFDGEAGLLGMAFHPAYQADAGGFFFVNYVFQAGGNQLFSRISRFEAGANKGVVSADPNSETVFIEIVQPFQNHNSGMIDFGPFGFLYVTFGDGGSGGDPGDNAQDLSTLLGKLLRIDVDAPDNVNGTFYSIPPDNPFAGNEEGIREEIWAFGLRNPWRWSFDRATMDMFIADVGQSSLEEIDFLPVTSTGGENFGWNVCEGSEQFQLVGPCEDVLPDSILPIFEYGRTEGRSVTGGFVYHGAAIPALQGTYFFADFVFNRIWSFRFDGAMVTEFTERTDALTPSTKQGFGGISSFGEDADGELYFVDYGVGEAGQGRVFRIVDVSVNEGVGEGAGEGVGEGIGEGMGEGAGEGSGEGAGEGSGEGAGEGVGEGASEGSGEGAAEGAAEGMGEGSGEGAAEGMGEGAGEGAAEGMGDGAGEGAAEGAGDGAGEGEGEGEGEGAGEKPFGCDTGPGGNGAPMDGGSLLVLLFTAVFLASRPKRPVAR